MVSSCMSDVTCKGIMHLNAECTNLCTKSAESVIPSCHLYMVCAQSTNSYSVPSVIISVSFSEAGRVCILLATSRYYTYKQDERQMK